MRKTTLLILALILFGCNKPVKIEPAETNLRTKNGFDETAISLIAEHTNLFPENTQLSIALLKDSVVYFFGSARKQDKLVNIDNHQGVFEIGSISKVFTSTLLADFVHNDKVKLEEPIQTYLPFPLKESEKDGKPITLQTLANHTSGLPRLPGNMILAAILNQKNPYRKYSEQKLEKYLKEKMAIITIPSEKNAYSNLGAGLISYTLSSISGSTYEELLQEIIFEPLQMTSSTTQREKIVEKLIQGLNKHGKETPNWDLNALSGAGAILSTVEDLSKFAQANFSDDPVLALQRIKTFEINEKMSLALGWHIITAESGQNYYWHNGKTGGYSSSMAIHPENKTGVIILSNIAPDHPKGGDIDQLCFELMKLN